MLINYYENSKTVRLKTGKSKHFIQGFAGLTYKRLIYNFVV
jgi:hypothetical protein